MTFAEYTSLGRAKIKLPPPFFLFPRSLLLLWWLRSLKKYLCILLLRDDTQTRNRKIGPTRSRGARKKTAVSRQSDVMQFYFYMYKYLWFWNKTENIRKNVRFLSDTLAKTSKDTVAYSFISEYTKHFFKNKKTNFWTLPLIMNVIFDVLPRGRYSTMLSFNIFSCMTVLVFGAPCFRARHIPHHPRIIFVHKMSKTLKKKKKYDNHYMYFIFIFVDQRNQILLSDIHMYM